MEMLASCGEEQEEGHHMQEPIDGVTEILKIVGAPLWVACLQKNNVVTESPMALKFQNIKLTFGKKKKKKKN